MKKIEFFYPSFTKKALTFTIDDGNMVEDAKLLAILAPAGIKGTFNLCSNIHLDIVERTKAFYSGYDIANHSKHHPLVNFDGIEYVISNDTFDPQVSDPTKIYKVDGRDGFFWLMRPNGWRQMVFEEDFLNYIKEGKEELEGIFSDREVKDFVWPYGEQNNAAAHDLIKKIHRSSRKTGCTRDTTSFDIPSDKYAWSYNADDNSLLEVMEKYEAYPDDGRLKFFAFGVHSVDFERDGKWGDLKEFALKYGNRPDTYWYASVGEIFDYEEAIASVKVIDGEIVNLSSLAIYLKLDGEKMIIAPNSKATI